jgi:hypothetical protein
MANLYYSHSYNRRGVLRAVLSSDEGGSLLRGHSARYARLQFPTGQDTELDFAVLRIFEGEMSEEWQAGFYVFEGDLAQIEEAVQACTEELAGVAKHPARSKV